MSFTKTLDNDLKVSLLTEDPFLYAHLVKFENVPDDPSGLLRQKFRYESQQRQQQGVGRQDESYW